MAKKKTKKKNKKKVLNLSSSQKRAARDIGMFAGGAAGKTLWDRSRAGSKMFQSSGKGQSKMTASFGRKAVNMFKKAVG